MTLLLTLCDCEVHVTRVDNCRQQLERAPRRQLAEVAKATTAGVVTGVETSGAATSSNNNNAATTSRYLLARYQTFLTCLITERGPDKALLT